MGYFNRYIKFREELWSEFEKLVRNGATFPELLDVTYPRGINPEGLSVDTDGDSSFYAKFLEANPDYQMHIGEDIIVGTNKVVFIDSEGKRHEIEPNILDTYWVAQTLDEAKK